MYSFLITSLFYLVGPPLFSVGALLTCNGNGEIGKACMVQAVLLASGARMTVALIYRWKGFEEAVAKLFRTMRHHHLLPRTLRLMYPAKTVLKAQRDEQKAIFEGRDVDQRTKQNVRGGACTEFIVKPSTVKHVAWPSRTTSETARSGEEK